jgi:hypothetical protein
MKKTKIIIALMLLSYVASAQMTLTTDKTTYHPHDTVTAKVTVENTLQEPVQWLLTVGFSSQDESHVSRDQETNIRLLPEQEITLNLTTQITRIMPPGNYEVIAQLLDGENTIQTAKSQYTVSGTLLTLPVNILICPDMECQQARNALAPWEKPHLKTASDVEGVTWSVQIEPSQQTIQIESEMTELPISEPGAYTLTAHASKDGYEPKTVTAQIYISAKEPDTSHTRACVVDGHCAPGENEINCPQDCPPKARGEIQKTEEKGICNNILPALIAALLALAALPAKI